jgi:cytochrome b
MMQRILVWDLPTRIFHWSFAMSFLVAYLTGESERWAKLHVIAGYTLLGLILFRLVWGFAGTRYARFSSFAPTRHAIASYLASLLQRRPDHSVGHNPAGALAIFALLSLGLLSGITGWMIYEDIGGDWLEEVHEVTASLMLAVVGIHIVGVFVSSRLHGENLVQAMISGKKSGTSDQAISRNRLLVALLLLASLIGFWVWSFTDAGQVLYGGAVSTDGIERSKADDDDD